MNKTGGYRAYLSRYEPFEAPAGIFGQTLVELTGFEPMTPLRAQQVLSRLSYSPTGFPLDERVHLEKG